MQPTPIFNRRAVVLAGMATVASLRVAHAQNAEPTAPPRGADPLAPRGARLTLRDAYDRVAAAGYLEIREIEWEHGHYEVKARDAQGRRAKLYVDGDDGSIRRKVKRD